MRPRLQAEARDREIGEGANFGQDPGVDEVRQPGASGTGAAGTIRELKGCCMCPTAEVQPTFRTEILWFRDDS